MPDTSLQSCMCTKIAKLSAKDGEIICKRWRNCPHKTVRSNISTFFSNLILGTLQPPEFCTKIFKEFSLRILQACKKKNN